MGRAPAGAGRCRAALAGAHPVAIAGHRLPVPVPAEVAWSEVTAWAGPWPVDERWWDDAAHRRRSRWQVITANGTAHLLSQDGDRWAVEATYD